MKWTARLLLVSVALLPCRALAQPESAAKWIPIDLHEGSYLFLRGSVHGVETDCVLDSGAGITVLDRAFAKEIGLESQRTIPAQGVGGTETAGLVSGIEIEVGSVRLEGVTVATLDLEKIATMLGRPIPAILGKEIFHASVVDIDYPGSRIAFHDRESYRYEGTGRTVPLLPGRDGRKLVEARIEELPPAIFQLDTGSAATLDCFRGYTEENGLLEGRAPISTRLSGGVGGMFVSKVATLRSFTFAGYRMQEVPVQFPQTEKGAFANSSDAGNLGVGILARFRVIFDFASNRLHVEPGPDFDTTAFEKDRLGLMAYPVGDSLEVLHVAEQSPAEKAGWKKGDRITAVGGQRPGSLATLLDRLHEAARGETGTVVSVTSADGDERSMTLADYY